MSNPTVEMWMAINALILGFFVGIIVFAWNLLKKALEKYADTAIVDGFERQRMILKRDNDLEIEKFKGHLQRELESLRAVYQSAVQENQIKMSHLYAERAALIKRVWYFISDCGMEITIHDVLTDETKRIEIRAEFSEKVLWESVHFKKNRILLQPELGRIVHSAFQGLSLIMDDDHTDGDRVDRLRDELNHTLVVLEAEFQKILGSIPANINLATS